MPTHPRKAKSWPGDDEIRGQYAALAVEGEAARKQGTEKLETNHFKEAEIMRKLQNNKFSKLEVEVIEVEEILAILIDRLKGFQAGPFPCEENYRALNHLQDALLWLDFRKDDREKRGVEGKNLG